MQERGGLSVSADCGGRHLRCSVCGYVKVDERDFTHQIHTMSGDPPTCDLCLGVDA